MYYILDTHPTHTLTRICANTHAWHAHENAWRARIYM